MGAKSIRSKHDNYVNRARVLKRKMSEIFENKEYNAEITTSEVVCQSCGFKARYKFLRCPECNEVQK